MSDRTLAEIAATPVSTIAEVIAVMERIDGLLPNEDGLKWFNLLYLLVTKSVLENPPPGGWSAPEWLARLDVVFAGMYFDAIVKWTADTNSAPKAWQVLFDARHRPEIMRVQFALCGMNAHINYDLQFALVEAFQQQTVAPAYDSPQHGDFEYVNSILEIVEAKVIPFLATGIVGVIDEKLGRLDNLLAMWGVRKARDTAWAKSIIFRHLRNNQILRRFHVRTENDFTGAFGRALVIPAP